MSDEPQTPGLEEFNLLHLAREALTNADAQIEYLHEKFKPTGSGMSALAKIDVALTAIDRFFAARA